MIFYSRYVLKEHYTFWKCYHIQNSNLSWYLVLVIECPSNDPKLNPEHGTVSCTNSNYYNSLCTTKCKEGYTRKMETETVCGEDKTWSNKTPDCKGK